MAFDVYMYVRIHKQNKMSKLETSQETSSKQIPPPHKGMSSQSSQPIQDDDVEQNSKKLHDQILKLDHESLTEEQQKRLVSNIIKLQNLPAFTILSSATSIVYE